MKNKKARGALDRYLSGEKLKTSVSSGWKHRAATARFFGGTGNLANNMVEIWGINGSQIEEQ